MQTGTYTPDGTLKLYHLPQDAEIYDGMQIGSWANPDPDENNDLVLITGETISNDEEWDRLKIEAQAHGFYAEANGEGAFLRAMTGNEEEN